MTVLGWLVNLLTSIVRVLMVRLKTYWLGWLSGMLIGLAVRNYVLSTRLLSVSVRNFIGRCIGLRFRRTVSVSVMSLSSVIGTC